MNSVPYFSCWRCHGFSNEEETSKREGENTETGFETQKN